MSHPVLGIDHSFLLVADLDESAERYRRLGFTLSPRGTHSPEKGTANHTIIFRDDYLELLGIVVDTPLNAALGARLAGQGEGLHAIANRTSGADAAKPALAARGIATGEVSAFSRPLPLPGGGEGIASFRTLTFEPEGVPVGHFFLCQHETPELVWRPELREHENGATGLAGFVAVVDDPAAVAKTYAGFYAGGTVTPDEGGYRVDTGENSAPILLLSRNAAEALFAAQDIAATPANGYAGLRIAVSDLGRARAALDAAGIAFTETARNSVTVSPALASGVILEFVPA